MSTEIPLRIVNALLCLLLVAFAVVQYNDPDVYLWVPVYLLPAALAGVAAYRPERLSAPPLSVVLPICVIAAVGGTFWFWPADAGFWRTEVWWESEGDREGMGVMIVLASLLVVAYSGWRNRGGDG